MLIGTCGYLLVLAGAHWYPLVFVSTLWKSLELIGIFCTRLNLLVPIGMNWYLLVVNGVCY